MSQKTKSPKSPALDLATLKELAKSKDIAKLEDIDINQLTTHSGPVLKRINALKNEQYEMLKLEAKFYEELHELECKYAKLYEPFYEKRRKIVSGDYEPTEEEGKWALDEVNGEEKPNGTEENKTEAADEDKKGIPNFWLETLQSYRITAEIIQEYDEPILAFLKDIRVKLFDKKPYGFSLEFEFAENPYFSNQVLTKTYELKTDIDPKDPFSYEGPDLEKSTGCKIDWKAGKDVTVKLMKKKIKPRNKKSVPKVITKEVKQDSFFNFFETPKSKSGDENKQVALKKDEEDELSEGEENQDLYLIADFEIGQYIREKVVPKAVLYYTGELDDMDEDDYDDYDEEDEDEEDEDDNDDNEEDEDDDDDDDDDEDDEDDGKGKKGAKNKKSNSKSVVKQGKGGKAGEPTPSECKQN